MKTCPVMLALCTEPDPLIVIKNTRTCASIPKSCSGYCVIIILQNSKSSEPYIDQRSVSSKSMKGTNGL